jgi:hypothetical protein
MMAFTPRALTPAELNQLARHTAALTGTGGYADWVATIEKAWSPSKLGTARDAAFAARPRVNRCVYCQDGEGREIDHLRPKTLHPVLAFNWDNLIPACATCGDSGHKGVRDAILDPSQPAGWREITRPHPPRSSPLPPVQPPPAGPTAWWNPRRADPLRAMKLDIVDGSFQFFVTATPGSADHARMEWTLAVLELNTRSVLVRQRRAAYGGYVRWLADVVGAHRAGDSAKEALLRADLADQNQPVVWAEMKRQRADLPDIDALLTAAPQVLAW